MVCAPRSTFLHILGIQNEPACRVSDYFANCVALGHRVKRISTISPPESNHHGPGQRSLGLRIDHLPAVWPARAIKISVPSLSLLGENPRRIRHRKKAPQRDHPNPGAHRPLEEGGFIGWAPRLSSSKRISSEVSGSSVGGNSWAALSIATKALKASARAS